MSVDKCVAPYVTLRLATTKLPPHYLFFNVSSGQDSDDVEFVPRRRFERKEQQRQARVQFECSIPKLLRNWTKIIRCRHFSIRAWESDAPGTQSFVWKIWQKFSRRFRFSLRRTRSRFVICLPLWGIVYMCVFVIQYTYTCAKRVKMSLYIKRKNIYISLITLQYQFRKQTLLQHSLPITSDKRSISLWSRFSSPTKLCL